MAEIVVTTSVRVTGECLARAQEAGEFLGARVVARDRRGLAKLCEQERAEGVLVIGSTDVYHEPANGLEFFFHPNLAKMRIGNMKGGKPDHLVSAMGLREGITCWTAPGFRGGGHRLRVGGGASQASSWAWRSRRSSLSSRFRA